MIRLPPHVRAALAKRRGTKAQREAVMAAQAPTGVAYQEALQRARDLVRDRDEQTLAARRKRFVKAISPRNRETPED